MMIHDIDALNWVFGAPLSVTANGIRNPRSGGWDQVQILIDYGTTSAVVDGGMMMPESYPFSSTLQVLGSEGFVEYDFRAGGRSVDDAGGTNELLLFPNEGEPVAARGRSRSIPIWPRSNTSSSAFALENLPRAPPRPLPASRSIPPSPPANRWNRIGRSLFNPIDASPDAPFSPIGRGARSFGQPHSNVPKVKPESLNP